MNVVIMGGLGNQFFQIAYAHELVGRFSSKRVNLVHAGQIKPYRDFLISPLLENCSHLDFRGESFFIYRLDNFVASIFKFKTLVRYILKLLSFFLKSIVVNLSIELFSSKVIFKISSFRKRLSL